MGALTREEGSRAHPTAGPTPHHPTAAGRARDAAVSGANWKMDTRPHTVGLCFDCRRPMWAGWRQAPVRVSPNPRYCQGCDNWRQHHPGGDPQLARNTHAELIRAEWPEGDARWRRRGNCAGTDEPEIFDPEPLDEDKPAGWTRELFEKTQQYAADAYCSDCPVLHRCLIKAAFHGYEGVRGGVAFDREQWRCLLTGQTGPTINHRRAPQADRGYLPTVGSAEETAAA